MCVCQLLLSAVCSRVCVQVTHFILLFLCLLFFLSFVHSKLPNLFTSSKEKNQQLSYLSFRVLVCSYLHGCCVCACVVSFSVDYRWVSGYLYFIYLDVCMCVVRVIIIASGRISLTKAENFCFVVMHGSSSRVRFLFFNGVIIYLYVYVFSVYLYVLFSVLKNNIHQRYIKSISFNG